MAAHRLMVQILVPQGFVDFIDVVNLRPNAGACIVSSWSVGLLVV